MTKPPLAASKWKIWTLVTAGAVAELAVAEFVGRAAPPLSAFGLWLQLGLLWALILVLAIIASRRIEVLAQVASSHETAHQATLGQVGQLEIQNALLKTLARSSDIGLAFQSLARQIVKVIPCDRLGLALLKENGQDLQTFTARVTDEERRHRPRPDLEFPVDRTVIGTVIASRKALVTNEIARLAADYIDANVLHGAGFRAVLFVPLVAGNRVLGTLNLVARSPDAFVSAHIAAIDPVAEILAVGILAQQLQVALGRYRTMEIMAELTLSIANEINGAVQAIVGQCDLLERTCTDAALQRDLSAVIVQAHRISDLLDKMRQTTQQRLKEVAASVDRVGVPSSPEPLSE
jgi:transcriptional regulator with GAF, ATPase, and Fis domain